MKRASTKRDRASTKLTSKDGQPRAKMPDFMKRMRAIYKKQLTTSGAEIVAEDRDRY